MPQISVIVPVYNVEVYIHRCIDSILEQSFIDFELILVDDGSPDNCGAICDEYAQKDSRVHVIHQENGGLSAARNSGIDWTFANSDSQWLTFIDSDDHVHKDYLQFLFAAATSTNVLISRCKHQEVPDGKSPATVDTSAAQFQVLDSFSAYSSSACMKLFRKKCFSQIRFPVGKLHEDAFIMHRLFFAVDRVAMIDLPLYYYMINSGSITHALWRPKRIDELEAFEEQLRFYHSENAECHYQRALISYLYVIMGQAHELSRSPDIDNRKYYLSFMKKKMRTGLWKNRKRVPSLSVKTYPHFYEIAYPGLMCLYWTYKGLRNKFHIF